MEQLQNFEQLQKRVQSGTYLLLKHSNTCPISMAGFHEFRAFTEAHHEQPAGYLVIQENRAFSSKVAEATGVRHESPQVLLFHNRKVVWAASHYEISKQSIATEVAKWNAL